MALHMENNQKDTAGEKIAYIPRTTEPAIKEDKGDYIWRGVNK